MQFLKILFWCLLAFVAAVFTISNWNAVQIQISGPLNKSVVERTMRTIEAKRRSADVNLVCLRLDSPGGSPTASVELANYLTAMDSSQIRTVGYVANQALADAAVIAVACDHLVMERGAILGGPGACRASDFRFGLIHHAAYE